MRACAWIWLAAAGCSSGFEKPAFEYEELTTDPPAGTDAGADTDVPGDTDAGADTDAPEETARPPAVDTAAPPGETGDTAVLPFELLAADVYCPTTDDVLAVVEATATSGVAILNLWETGAPAGLGWNEEHDLPVISPGPPELLEREVVDVSVAGSYVRNASSLFECTQQFALFATSLTAAVRVTDPVSGDTACWIWGDDPNMVLGGMFKHYTPVTDPATLVGCTILP